jgi:PAS domain S-box-containing protein
VNRPAPDPFVNLAKRFANSGWLRDLALIVLLAATYIVAGELALKLELTQTVLVAIWPPSGIAVAALILLGYRVWPSILLGIFVLDVYVYRHPLTSLAIASANSLEGLAAAYLVNKYARGAKALDTAGGVVRFVLYACVVSPAISATIAIGTLYLSRMATRAELTNLWTTWWLGNGSGILLLAPFLLILFDRPHHSMDGREILELTCMVLGMVLIAMFAFGPLSPTLNRMQFVRAWMCIPFLIWAAFRFCQLEVAGLTILLFGTAVWGTVHGFGYFVTPDPHLSLLNLDAFIAVIGTMSLAVAAMVAERRGIVTRLLGIQSLLQEAVAGKDRDLTATVETLHMEVVEHLESERALRASHERLRLQMDNPSDVFWIFDTIAERVLYVSPAYESLWGRSCQSLYADAHSWLDGVHPDDRDIAFAILDEQKGKGDRFAVEYRLLRPDGSTRWICDRGFVIRDETGRTCCLASIASDITGKKGAGKSSVTSPQKETETQ